MPDTEKDQDVNVVNVNEDNVDVSENNVEIEVTESNDDEIVSETDIEENKASDDTAVKNAPQPDDAQPEDVKSENVEEESIDENIEIESVDEQEAPITEMVPEKELVEEEEEVDEDAVREAIIKQKKTKFERQRLIKKIASITITSLVWIVGSLLLLLCASNLYQQFFNPGGYTGFFGIGEAVVASRSMEPMLYENDLIFYHSVDTADVNPQDVIVYQKTDGSSGNTILIVHEVQQIGDGYVVTKGINNAVEDEAFPTSAIVGKYMFKISQAGKLLNLLTTVWAPILIILMIVVVFALRILYYIVYKKKTIEKISNNENTRLAIDHFFEI